MVPVVLASTKTLLLYSAAPWLAGGIAIGYLGKHFSAQNKLNLAEIKRQAEEIEQLRSLQQQMESRISALQGKAVKTTRAVQRKIAGRAGDANKGIFLKNLLDANVRLRKDIAAQKP